MVLRECNRCLVLLPRIKKTIEARVEILTKDTVVLFFPDYQLSDERVKTLVRFFDDRQGIVDAECELVIRKNKTYMKSGEPWMATCTIKEVKKAPDNKRREIRLKTHLEIMGQAEKRGSFAATIKDISAGGLYLTTLHPLGFQEHFTFSCSLDGIPLQLGAMVLRGKREPDGRYGYGCKFVNLTGAAETTVVAYIYRKLQGEKGRG